MDPLLMLRLHRRVIGLRARAENLDWSQRSHPLVPVIRGLHLHERPIEMLIAMERPIGLRVITTGRIGRTRLKRVSMES